MSDPGYRGDAASEDDRLDGLFRANAARGAFAPAPGEWEAMTALLDADDRAVRTGKIVSAAWMALFVGLIAAGVWGAVYYTSSPAPDRVRADQAPAESASEETIDSVSDIPTATAMPTAGPPTNLAPARLPTGPPTPPTPSLSAKPTTSPSAPSLTAKPAVTRASGMSIALESARDLAVRPGPSAENAERAARSTTLLPPAKPSNAQVATTEPTTEPTTTPTRATTGFQAAASSHAAPPSHATSAPPANTPTRRVLAEAPRDLTAEPASAMDILPARPFAAFGLPPAGVVAESPPRPVLNRARTPWRWSVGPAVARELTAVDLGGTTEHGTRGGLRVIAYPSTRWSLSLGVDYVSKDFTADAGEFDEASVAWAGGIKPIRTEVDCRSWEFPLAASYLFAGRDRASAFVAVGLSSYRLARERMRFDYPVAVDDAILEHDASYEKNGRVFGLAKVSLGWRHTRGGSKPAWRLGPYAQAPTRGLGMGSVDLYAGGIEFLLEL